MSIAPFRAEVSPLILKKADRLFSNRLSAIFIELVQNSRRAGASLITVTAVREKSNDTTLISFEDDGIGLEDFSSLLHLGHSDWNSEIERRDGPAGMGFFSLMHSEVLVQSRGMSALVSPEAFLGNDSVTMEPSTEAPLRGTRLSFRRAEKVDDVIAALTEVAKYGSVDVRINGTAISRCDFLARSLYIKTVDGVRIGVFPGSDYRTLCNFHGSVIELRNRAACLTDVIIPDLAHSSRPADLHVKIDVLETTSLHLKLPDRTQVVEDKAFEEMMRKGRIAMFEYLATLPVHCASYSTYLEAHRLGVPLAEAAPFLCPYFVPARNSDHEGAFTLPYDQISARVVDLSQVALVEHDNDACDPEAFTFEVGYSRLHNVLPLKPVERSPRYEGYSWYETIPRYRDLSLRVDGKPVAPDDQGKLVSVVDSIELQFELKRPAEDALAMCWKLPFTAFGDDDRFSESNCLLILSRESPWVTDSDPSAGPFSLIEAAQYLGFTYQDDAESDSYETQQEAYQNFATRELTRALGGELEMARMELQKVTTYSDLTVALNAAGIREVHLTKGKKGWSFTIVEPA